MGCFGRKFGKAKSRLVRVGGAGHHMFPKNNINTTKYNLITFLPRFLFEQFQRVTNIFFLVISGFQLTPGVGSKKHRYTTIGPLGFILFIAALKEIFEDVQRHFSDRSINRRKVKILHKGEWKIEQWNELRVGELVMVKKDEGIPADIVILSSSEPAGLAYIETSNLDGESNLKIRQANPSTAQLIDDNLVMDFADLGATIDCDLPNAAIYEYTGVLSYRQNDKEFVIPLNYGNLLPRGAKLKNTDWIYGVVVYTGRQTKLMMNSNRTPLKRSYVDYMANYQILMMFGVMVIVSSLMFVGTRIWDVKHEIDHWYIAMTLKNEEEDRQRKWFPMTILSYVVILYMFVPISLQVTLELVRVCQAWFIRQDLDMYHEPTDTRAEARNSNLNEELGQVKYILTDKTGTLTQNMMKFKMCSIGGMRYVHDEDDSFTGSQLELALQDPKTAPLIRDFVRLMALCHTVVPEKVDDIANVTYHASSPDEAALVRGAKSMGVIFHTRTPRKVVINAWGVEEEYEVMNVLEFTSSRKRMGVILRAPDRKIKLLVKGADSTIFERLASNGAEHREATSYHLAKLANLGFRTLCLAMADISEEEYFAWEPGYYDASVALVDREQRLEEQAELIEKNLVLLGTTAIEDKLQDGVPEAIAQLLEADIKIWVLTGDKLETAINIGHSCSLIKPDMPTMIVARPDADSTRDCISSFVQDLGACIHKRDNDIALVIDGQSLGHALEQDQCVDFLRLALCCRVVVCCRCSPMQKAAVVEMVKNSVGVITLAIGDGANDVAMIQAAHVGIGINGEEGMQASLAADYSIAQFRFLLKLLFVHGSWSYHRMVKIILYCYYKNIILAFLQTMFMPFACWSAVPLLDPWSSALFNVMFTPLPPLAMGLFDRPAPSDWMLKYPKLYWMSQDRSSFSPKVFWSWFLCGVYHASVIFFGCYMVLKANEVWSSDGRVGSPLVLGDLAYTVMVLVVNLKAALEIDSWVWITPVSLGTGVMLWFAFLSAYSVSRPWFKKWVDVETTGRVDQLFMNWVFWFALVLIVVSALLADLIFKVIRRTFFRTIQDEVLHLEGLKGDDFDVLYSPFMKMRDLVLRRSDSVAVLTKQFEHGYAFSQEEHGAVSQRDLVRSYDSRGPKKAGSPLPSDHAAFRSQSKTQSSHFDPTPTQTKSEQTQSSTPKHNELITSSTGELLSVTHSE